MTDPRLRLAVDASVAWYEEIFALHGIQTTRADGLWSGLAPAPPLHSDAVAIEAGVSVETVGRRLANREHAAFADPFGDVDARVLGMDLLFAATWIHREPEPEALPEPDARWRPVRHADALAAWNARWDTAEVLLPGVLSTRIVVLERLDGDRPVAGAALLADDRSVLISNVHGVDGHHVDWSELATAVQARYPHRSMVGYERDADLADALAAGWQPVGEHRVWVR